jgi:hypothetical protein
MRALVDYLTKKREEKKETVINNIGPVCKKCGLKMKGNHTRKNQRRVDGVLTWDVVCLK